MGLVVALLLGAVAVGALLGGSIRRLAAQRLRRWPLLVGALAAQVTGVVAGARLSAVAYPIGMVTSAALVLGLLGSNRRLPGSSLVAGGVLCNAAVVAANGAMPVFPSAASAAGVDLAAVVAGLDAQHELVGPGTRLRFLGDVVPVPLPVRPEVVSPGDAAAALGLALLVVAGMRRAPAPYRPGLVRLRHWTATPVPLHGRKRDGETIPQAQGPRQEQGQSR